MWHVGEREKTDQCIARPSKEVLQFRYTDIIALRKDSRAERNDYGDGAEQPDLCRIELKAAISNTRRADKPPLTQKGAAKRDGAGHARNEHEHVGGIADAIARRNKVIKGITATMRDVDDEHRGAAGEIEPRITLWLSGLPS